MCMCTRLFDDLIVKVSTSTNEVIEAIFGGLPSQALGDGKVKHGFHLSTNPRFEPSCEQPTNANLDEVAGQCVKSFSESPSY